MPHSARKIDDMLGALPLDDRSAALVVNIIERRPEGVRAVLAMIAATVVMTHELSLANKIALAEILRDAADLVEQRNVDLVV